MFCHAGPNSLEFYARCYKKIHYIQNKQKWKYTDVPGNPCRSKPSYPAYNFTPSQNWNTVYLLKKYVFCLLSQSFLYYLWSEIVLLKPKFYLLTLRPPRGGRLLNKLLYREALPEVQPLTLLYNIFHEKGAPLSYTFLSTNGIPFNCCKCIVI